MVTAVPKSLRLHTPLAVVKTLGLLFMDRSLKPAARPAAMTLEHRCIRMAADIIISLFIVINFPFQHKG